MSDAKKPAPAPRDPAAVLRDWLSQGETRTNSVLNRAMATDAFAMAFGLSGALLLGWQKMVGDLMPKFLAAAHVPSREEVTAIGEQLAALEERLIRVSDALGAPPAASAAAAARPPKTRKPRPAAPVAASAAATDAAVATAPTPAPAPAPKRAVRKRAKPARAESRGATK